MVNVNVCIWVCINTSFNLKSILSLTVFSSTSDPWIHIYMMIYLEINSVEHMEFSISLELLFIYLFIYF